MQALIAAAQSQAGSAAVAKGTVSKLGGALAKGSGAPLGKLTQGPAAQTGLQKFGSTLKKVGGVLDKLPKKPAVVDNTLPSTSLSIGGGVGGSPPLDLLSKVFSSTLSETEEQPDKVGQLKPGFSRLDQGGF